MSSRLNLLYCVKYKRKTDTVNILQITTTNNKNMNKGICSNCGKNKSSFISNILLGVEPSVLEVEPSIGKGFSLNSFVNNLPIELHQFAEKGEDVPGRSFNNQQKYSYCGSGTKYEQRVREG